jgi:hypothetical protein
MTCHMRRHLKGLHNNIGLTRKDCVKILAFWISAYTFQDFHYKPCTLLEIFTPVF